MWVSDKYDSRDLGDWIIQQDWSNGQVATLGASADGMGSIQTPMTNPSWLSAQYIIWAPAYVYQILFPYGTYKQKTTEDWLMGLTMPNPDFVNTDIEIVHHNEYHSDFWRTVELNDTVLSYVNYPNGFWGGWYDLFILGTIQAFDGYNTKSNPAWQGKSIITIDPLGHCLDFADFFTEDAVMGRTGLVIAQLFETYGVFNVKRSGIKSVTFYVMSSNDEAGKAAGQYWTSLDTWPSAKMTDYYFHADKTASMKPPTSSESTATSYKHDPANPVPTLGGNNLPDSIGGTIPCGPMDQSPLNDRTDVLSFTTEVFTSELALSGGISATIYVSSDAIDTDFMVKISDVYPTGEVRILQDNAVRMRWRNDGDKPEYLEKNTVYPVEMNLWNTSYIVAPGHALRFSISSSNFPRFSVNGNNGLLLDDENYPGPNIVATNTLYHSLRYPSKISLPVVNKRQIPQVHVLKELQAAYPVLTDEFIKEQAAKMDKALRKRSKH